MPKIKMPINPLAGFLGHQVKICTNIEVQDGYDENDQPRWGKQAYVGTLINFDDYYLLLGIITDFESTPHYAVSHSQVIHIEFYNGDEQEPVQVSSEGSILN